MKKRSFIVVDDLTDELRYTHPSRVVREQERSFTRNCMQAEAEALGPVKLSLIPAPALSPSRNRQHDRTFGPLRIPTVLQTAPNAAAAISASREYRQIRKADDLLAPVPLRIKELHRPVAPFEVRATKIASTNPVEQHSFYHEDSDDFAVNPWLLEESAEAPPPLQMAAPLRRDLIGPQISGPLVSLEPPQRGPSLNDRMKNLASGRAVGFPIDFSWTSAQAPTEKSLRESSQNPLEGGFMEPFAHVQTQFQRLIRSPSRSDDDKLRRSASRERPVDRRHAMPLDLSFPAEVHWAQEEQEVVRRNPLLEGFGTVFMQADRHQASQRSRSPKRRRGASRRRPTIETRKALW